MIRNVVTIALSGLACVACTSLDSVELRTNGMKPDMVVRSSAEQANSKLDVQIHVGDSLVDFVDLVDPDVLTVQVDGAAAVELTENNLLGATGYSTDIATKAPGTEIKVILTRGPDDDGAPSSTVTLTEQLALTAPAAGAALSRADDDIVVTWTSEASDDDVSVSLSGDCIQPANRAVAADATTVTFEKGSVLKREDPEEGDPIPDSCDATVRVVRTRTGALDPAFGGGGIRHEFSAQAGVTTNP